MAQMFRAVKCDSKRSQSDWQEEYANRKRARIEEDRKVSQKQVSSSGIIKCNKFSNRIPRRKLIGSQLQHARQ